VVGGVGPNDANCSGFFLLFGINFVLRDNNCTVYHPIPVFGICLILLADHIIFNSLSCYQLKGFCRSLGNRKFFTRVSYKRAFLVKYFKI
jgi:hypothetical protein